MKTRAEPIKILSYKIEEIFMGSALVFIVLSLSGNQIVDLIFLRDIIPNRKDANTFKMKKSYGLILLSFFGLILLFFFLDKRQFN